MYTSEYPIQYLTADIITYTDYGLILIRRKGEPFKGYLALPGGYINHTETAQEAAKRELQEETGLDLPINDFSLYVVADKPDRDPRGRTVSLVYITPIVSDISALKAGDDAEHVLTMLPEQVKHYESQFAFDHYEILSGALWQK